MSPNIVGKRFGRLIALEKTIFKNRKYWICKCDCGKSTLVTYSDLKRSHTTSCGCYHTERIRSAKTHGVSRTRIYKIYKGMKQRCYNSNNPNYKDYGLKGVKVCDEWLDDPSAFYEWSIKNGYKPSLTIDRIDSNKGYSPNNCRWATRLQQSNNLNTNKVIEFKGESRNLSEWSKITKINYSTLQQRFNRDWTTEEALTIPIGGKRNV